jgi:aconitate hydratase
MAGVLLAASEPGFAERARRQGGGWMVAGKGFLRGEAAAAVAACMAEVGVWGILAGSYAPGAARTLAHAGVIPFTIPADGPRRGDEVEVAGLPEALVPGHPIAGRDLTRGVHLSLAHDLSAREIAILQAGGLVAFAARSGPRGQEE